MHYKRGVNLETGELYLNKLYLYTVSILITVNSDSENVVYDPFFPTVGFDSSKHAELWKGQRRNRRNTNSTAV